MNSHRNTAGNNSIFMLVRAAKLIKSVPAFVNYGVHGGSDIVLIVMGCNAHIIFCKLKGKGVLRFAAVAVIGVNAHIIHHILGNKLLLFYREISEKR